MAFVMCALNNTLALTEVVVCDGLKCPYPNGTQKSGPPFYSAAYVQLCSGDHFCIEQIICSALIIVSASML